MTHATCRGRAGIRLAAASLSIAGCTHEAAFHAAPMEVSSPITLSRAGRTAVEREKLEVVERFGGVSADRRRLDFDYWNMQLVREDVAVSTVFLGDSITEFWELQAFFRASDGIVVNRGISSDTAQNMAKRFAADVVQLRPHNVVILAGDNDISLAPAGTSDAVLVEAINSYFETMAQASQAAGIRVLLCSIPPMTAGPERHARFKAIVPTINERIHGLCAQRECVFVDYAAAMRNSKGDLRPELTGDGIHPNNDGFRVMAQVLKDALRKNQVRL